MLTTTNFMKHYLTLSLSCCDTHHPLSFGNSFHNRLLTCGWTNSVQRASYHVGEAPSEALSLSPHIDSATPPLAGLSKPCILARSLAVVTVTDATCCKWGQTCTDLRQRACNICQGLLIWNIKFHKIDDYIISNQEKGKYWRRICPTKAQHTHSIHIFRACFGSTYTKRFGLRNLWNEWAVSGNWSDYVEYVTADPLLYRVWMGQVWCLRLSAWCLRCIGRW